MDCIKLFTIFTGLFMSAVFLWVPSARATMCDLGGLSSDIMDFSLELDEVPQQVSVEKHYIFTEEGKKGKRAVKISEISFITLHSFTKMYANFAVMRVGPAERCDSIETGGFQTAVDDVSGLAFGKFLARYEDNVCFNLRFFQPNPDVKKEPMQYKLSDGLLEVNNAFQPKIESNSFTIAAATSYEGEGSGQTLERLYRSPLDGFLQDPVFVQLVHDTVSGLGDSDAFLGFKAVDARFVSSADNKAQLKITSQKNFSYENTCRFRKDLTASGFH